MTPGFARHGVRFALAGPEDDAAIASLLALPMPGWVELAFEGAPDRLRPMRPGAAHAVALARSEADGTPVGMVSCTDVPSFVDGTPAPVTWVGQWRIAPAWRGRPALLRAGPDALGLLDGAPVPADGPPPCRLAAIVADNAPARRLLEANVRGLPGAERLFGLRTLAMPARRGNVDGVRRAEPGDMAEVAAFVDGTRRRRQFAPRLGPGSDVVAGRWPGLGPGSFLVGEGRDGIASVVAVWDQRPHRRTVVRGYRAPLGATRALANLVAPITRLPRLPPVGSALAVASLAFLAVADDDPDAATALVRAALDAAARRGLTLVSLGLAENDPLLAPLARTFRYRAYRSDVYRIGRSGDGAVPPPSIGRPKVEIALL